MKVNTNRGLIIVTMFVLLCAMVLPAEAAQKPDAKFSVTPTSGNVPLTVTFTDQSTGGKALWKWWGFGDGTGSSSNANTVTHTYTKAGTYTVFLKATNAAGSDTETKLNYITVGGDKAQKPDAKFSVTPTSGNVPLTVTFTDQSTGGKALWKWWGFGDGTGSSSNANTVTHTYTKAGTYTVFLKATNAAGSDTETKLNYITVQTSNEIIYKFDSNNGKDGKSPWGISFNNLPTFKGYHLPAKEGYIAVESQYNFIDSSISSKNKDPTNGNGYYFNTLSPDNMQWKWDGHTKLLGTIKLIPGSQDHVSIDKYGIKHLPSGKGAKVRIYSPYTGKTVIAVVGENGPAPWTGRQFGASNKVFEALGLPYSHASKGMTFSRGNPNPGHASSGKTDPANYPVKKYTDNPYWVEVSWADQSLPAGPLR